MSDGLKVVAATGAMFGVALGIAYASEIKAWFRKKLRK
jgi:hypothetical protein